VGSLREHGVSNAPGSEHRVLQCPEESPPARDTWLAHVLHCTEHGPGTFLHSMTALGLGSSLARSVVCAVVAACFALSALTYGATPVCSMPAHDTPAHGHSASHSHQQGGQLPGAAHCSVHLCCANLATPVVSSLALGRSFAAHQANGFDPVSSRPESRPAHFLPFAHAPPHALA
jgi:hypothetical protein